MNIKRTSSPQEKKTVSDTIYDKLGEYLFENLIFVTLIFSEAKNALDGSDVISTTDYIGTSRITDTSEGKYMNTGRESRMRCSFYLENPNKLDGYILSPAVFDSFSSLNTIATMDNLRSYVGIKFYQGYIYVAVKEAGRNEVLTDTGLTLKGTGASDTWELQVRHYIGVSEIYINGELIGSFTSDLIGTVSSTSTFLPLLAPARSTDGTAVGLVIENYQFIQKKN